MALTRPVSLFGRTRLHLYAADTTTSLGTIRGQGTSGTHSKDFRDSGLSLTVSVAEAVLAADETALEGAFVVPEVEYGGDWLAIGTPYMLAPGSGKVRGGDSKRSQSPVAVGLLRGLLEELVILPTECDTDHATFKRAGGIEQNRYLDYGSIGYSETLHTWHDADIYDPTGEKKAGKPDGFPDDLAAAEWVFRDADEGGRTFFREDTFTLADDQRCVFFWCSDENGKMMLDGPNQGGCLIDWTAEEDGYNQGVGHKSLRLKAGTYRPAGWMLSINSVGGDGNDSARYGAYSIKTDGSGDVDQVLFVSGPNTRVLRQPTTDEFPGMSPGEKMRRLLQVCEDVADGDDNAATLLLALRTFTDTLDTTTSAWTTFTGSVWPLFTPLSSAFADLLADIDLDMGPTFTFDAWQSRGSDLSASVDLVGGSGTITAAMNIRDYSWDSDPAGPNAMFADTQDGLTFWSGTLPAGQRRRFGGAEQGSASSVGAARKVMRALVKASGVARRFYHGTAYAVADAVPYVDFNLCDVIHGRGYRDLGLDKEVTAMSWTQGDQTLVTLDLGESVT